MGKFDNRIESVLDGIMLKANDHSVELICDPMYDEDDPRYKSAVFVQNVYTERIGMLCLNLEDTDPDELQYLTFWPKMYQYSKQEGFSREESFKAFGDKIITAVTPKEFLKFILSDETY